MEVSKTLVDSWMASPNAATLFELSETDRRLAITKLAETLPGSVITLLSHVAPDRRPEILAIIPPQSLRKMIAELFPKQHRTKDWADFCPWSGLRPLGNFALFKVSYIALLLLPWVSRIVEYLQVGGYTYIGSLYFGDLFLALANLLYDIRCPSIIKRWESPNDFYIKMLEVAEKQQQCYPLDGWVGTLEHSKAAYNRLALSRRVSRVACALLYSLGLALLAYVLVERSWHVLHPIVAGKTG